MSGGLVASPTRLPIAPMTNAAIYFHPDGFDTSRDRLMGRHAAGESFLRGFLRHGQVDNFYLFNATAAADQQLEAMVRKIEPTTKPIVWRNRRARQTLTTPGTLFLPGPSLFNESWLRRPWGSQAFSLCGITHTTATHRVMDAIAEMLVAPVEPWDTLICTSSAVRQSVEVEMEAAREDMRSRLGVTRFSEPKLATIPLGVNVDDFATNPTDRQAWRAKLGIPEDAIAVLFLGRFSAAAKMNPALMATALEQAAQQSGKEVHWICAGWSSTDQTTQQHHDSTRQFCPSIHYHAVDGRPADTRFSIWSAADVFISFSENIQETFGLTPVEAMAAGLPCVVTDWNGYRDTVRHGLDGFRIATYTPRSGLGRDLAFAHANEWINYDAYIAAAAQMTAIDMGAAIQALVTLFNDPDLRRKMGASGARQAREVFDWAAVIPQYQALWGEMDAIRLAGPRLPPLANPDNPRRMDPFRLFSSYPTATAGPDTVIRVPVGMTWPQAEEILARPFAALGAWVMPFEAERRKMFDFFAENPEAPISEMLKTFNPGRHPFIERGVLWLVKFGILEIANPVSVPND
jgi:glycosyltransferase involved in cell wall biosynthesis